ncbi:hypothetical protein PENTCL1PPCAC_25394, partial [Pristionchus entomophagus]
KEIKKDPNWKPPLPTTRNLPDSEYLMVSKDSLLTLLRQCNKCQKGQRNLSFRMEGLAFAVSGECTSCEHPFSWGNSTVLRTAKGSSRERLPKKNVDVVTGAVITSIGGTKLHQVMLMSGITPLFQSTFHIIKKFYVFPAVTEVFWKAQAAVIEALRARIAKGERVQLSGDGSFDSRGHSGAWCRYFFIDAKTGEVIHYTLMHKSHTGNKIEKCQVAALEQGLRELSYMIGGTEAIECLVTDRHPAVTKMMRTKFPEIGHFYDPWHFFRNITMTLL